MRKIRNQHIHSANPGLLFARGVEQLVSDRCYRPSRGDGKNARREPPSAANTAKFSADNLFGVFLRRFVF
jgi:hypothetical protein